jgi:hypothetical protein
MSVYRVSDTDYNRAEEAKKVLLSIELEVDPLNFGDDDMQDEIDCLKRECEELGDVKSFTVN